MFTWRLAAAILTFLLLGLSARAEDDVQGSKGSWTIGRYRVAVSVKVDRDSGQQAVLEVFDGAKSIYQQADAMFDLNPSAFFTDVDEKADPDATTKPYKIGEDVIGLGAPTLVARRFSGGAHCCFSLIILVLGDQFRALPQIDLLDSESVRFKALKPGAPLSFSTDDFSFGYWWAPFSDSAAAPVVRSYNSSTGRYEGDPDLMRAPAPTPEEMEKLIAAAIAAEHQTLNDGQSFVPYDVTSPILKLVYTGHVPEARRFLEKAWIGPPKNRELYWSDLTECQLRKSDYWPAVAQLNGLPASAPVPPCPRKEPDAPLGAARGKP